MSSDCFDPQATYPHWAGPARVLGSKFGRELTGSGKQKRIRFASWKHRSPIPRVRPWPLRTACDRPAIRQKAAKLLIYLRFLGLGPAGFEPEGRGFESLPARHHSHGSASGCTRRLSLQERCSHPVAAGVPSGAAKVEEAEVRLLFPKGVRVDPNRQFRTRVAKLSGHPAHGP